MENETNFEGREVVVYEAGQALGDPAAVAYRIAVEYESDTTWVDLFATFMDSPGVERVQALLIGAWDEATTGSPPDAVIEALVGARSKLPALRALFFADLSQEEAEISWIVSGDLSPILSAYPKLERLQIRGGQSLTLGKVDHAALRTLIIETGGMDRSIVAQVGSAKLPELQHLELYLGDDNYGANTSPADLKPIFDDRFPKLTTLGLRDCHYADELAKAVAGAKVLERIKTLDLSLGNLSDEGGEALLASPLVKKLAKLDLHHHYLSDAMMKRFEALGIEVDLEDQRESDEDGDDVYRYVAVGE